MLRVHLDGDDLARIRVGTCLGSLAESVFSLAILRSGAVEPLLTGWHRRIRSLEGGIPQLDVLLHAAWRLELVHTTRIGADQLRPSVAESSPVTPRWSVQVRLAGAPPTAAALSALRSYHEVAVEPYWNAIRATLAAARTQLQQVARQRGVPAMLGSLHPMIGWSPPELRLPTPARPARPAPAVVHHCLGGSGLVVVPSFFCRTARVVPPRSVSGSAPHLLLVPVTTELLTHIGAVWPLTEAPRTTLAALLGRTRAAVLQSLDAGACTTTELARRCGASLSSASQHAAVLRDAGLIQTERHRNAVLHSLTTLGESLLDGARPQPRRSGP